jgi:hypothetical protein
MRTLITAALLACLAAPALGAQGSPLRPGDTLSGARVAAGTLEFDMYLDGRTEGFPDAEYVLETRLAEVAGRPAVVRRETIRIGGEVMQVDSFALDRATLAPIARSDGAFLANSMDLLLGALPLADGYEAALAVREDGKGVVTARVRVTGREDVRTDRGPVRAWRVSVRGASTEGTYWLRQDTRTLVQFVAADRSMRIVLLQGAAGERDATR